MRQLLIRYGNEFDLMRHLLINFGNKGWMGKESDNIKRELERLNTLKNNEDDINVLAFIDKYKECLEYDLKRAIIAEERRY